VGTPAPQVAHPFNLVAPKKLLLLFALGTTSWRWSQPPYSRTRRRTPHRRRRSSCLMGYAR
jgi:hypothetical protein